MGCACAPTHLGDNLWFVAGEEDLGFYNQPTTLSAAAPSPLMAPGTGVLKPASPAPQPGFWSSPNAGVAISAGAGLTSTLIGAAGSIFTDASNRKIANMQANTMEMQSSTAREIAMLQTQAAAGNIEAQQRIAALQAQSSTKKLIILLAGGAAIAAIAAAVFIIRKNKAT